MKLKSILLLAVAVGCGLVAMLGVQQALSDDNEDDGDKVTVLVATADIMPGTLLDETNVTFKEWPKDIVPSGAVTAKEQFEDRALRAAAVVDEPIMISKLGEPGVYAASTDIPNGMRVVTVKVDSTTTHSGLLLPGDRVDILVTYKARSADRGTVSVTRTVLQYIKVFASDSQRQNSASADNTEVNAKNVSLLVTPEQAALVMLADSKGMLQLTLRHQGDDVIAEISPITDREFDAIGLSAGKSDEEMDQDPADDVDQVATRGDSNIEDLLNQEKEQADVEPVVEPPVVVPVVVVPVIEVEPEPPKWRIEIYEGGQKRVEEIELPLEQVKKADGENPAADLDAPGGFWGGMRKYLTGA